MVGIAYARLGRLPHMTAVGGSSRSRTVERLVTDDEAGQRHRFPMLGRDYAPVNTRSATTDNCATQHRCHPNIAAMP